MQTSHKVLSRYDAVICGCWKYLMLMKLDFAIVVNDEHVISINADDRIGSNLSFVCFAEDSN